MCDREVQKVRRSRFLQHWYTATQDLAVIDIDLAIRSAEKSLSA